MGLVASLRGGFSLHLHQAVSALMLHVAPSGSAMFHLPGAGIDDCMLEPHRASVDGACRIPLGSAMSFICTKPCLVDVARRILVIGRVIIYLALG